MDNSLGKQSIGKALRPKSRGNKKLHDIYVELFGKDFEISRGLEAKSQKYQHRLAKAALAQIKREMEKVPVSFTIIIRGVTITYRGKKTKQEIIDKYENSVF